MRSRKLTLLVSLAGAASLLAGFNLNAHAVTDPEDRTAPKGAFGFVTQGLGQTTNYGEPSLAIAPDGRHIVASTPGGGGVQVWYSSDGAKTFDRSSTTSSSGGGDSELDFLPDGTLLSADLEVHDSNIKISHDFGKTWDQGRAAGMEQDRQWFAHSPDGKTQYLVYHDFAAEAEVISKSTDGGKTWTHSPADQIFVTGPDQVAAPGLLSSPGQGGGDPVSLVDQGVNTFSGPLLADNNGKDLYVIYSVSDAQTNLDPRGGVPPYGPVRALVVAHSSDSGKTWRNTYAFHTPSNPDSTKETAAGTFFPWGFLDQKGTIYLDFNSNLGNEGTDKFHHYYIYSADKGAHWSKPIKIDTLPLHSMGAAVYNTGAAVKPGVIDLAWYQSSTGTLSQNSGVYRPFFAQVTHADTPHPVIKVQRVTDIPNHRGGVCVQGIMCGIAPGSGDRSLLDFFELAINPKNGLAVIAYADNNRLTPAGSATKRGEVVIATQTKQPRF